MGKTVILERDVDAVLVPSGQVFELKAGTPVRIIKNLGGNCSLEVFGHMVMVQALDVDALGLEPDTSVIEFINSDASLEEKVISVIKQCYDPEIPVNIYELGLIYQIQVEGNSVHIVMTLTSPTCGMGPYIVEDLKRKLHQIPKIEGVEIEIVYDPPWDKSRLSDEAKLQLNIF